MHHEVIWRVLDHSNENPQHSGLKRECKNTESSPCDGKKFGKWAWLQWDFCGFSPLFFSVHLQEPLIAKYFLKNKKDSINQGQSLSTAESLPLGQPWHGEVTSTRAGLADLPVTGKVIWGRYWCFRTVALEKLSWLTLKKTKHKQYEEGFLIRISLYAFRIPKPPGLYQSKLGTLMLGGYLFTQWFEQSFVFSSPSFLSP